MKLKIVRVITPVPFNSPQATTLHFKYGTLELDPKSRLITATPHKPTGICKATVIPMVNVAYFAPLEEEDVSTLEEESKPYFQKQALTAPEPETYKDDVYRPLSSKQK